MQSNDYGSVFTSTVQKFQERGGQQIKAAKKDALDSIMELALFKDE